ncbi:MAG: glycosyltransferase family protein [Spirochaetaceae bacterium]|nr:glycosyltransferase family protein [Spirochaetaceae bacterium]
MKRIGFSLAGEGRGHAARVVALSQILKNRYEIVYFCPETVQAFIRKHITNPAIITVPALNFVNNGHGIDYVGTLLKTLKCVKTLNRDISGLAEQIRRSEISALISDFEPYASWAAAICDVPVLNLNHPGVILKFLSLSPGAWVARSVAALMMPPAHKTIICSFYRGDVGPILRKEIREAQVSSGDYFLVYVKDSSRVRMRKALSRFTDVQFRVFPNSEEDFTQALAGCRGVIAPAGHQLISESLFLGKPVLAIPQRGQFEQRLNARMLKLSGRGDRGRFRTLEKDLHRFLVGIQDYPHAARGFETFRYDDDTERTAGMIMSFVIENSSAQPTRRTRFTWYRTIPEKIEALKNLPVRMPA